MRPKPIHWMNQILGQILTFLFSGMVILIIVLVLLRYTVGRTITGGYEILRFSFIYTTFLGAAALLNRREHIGMEVMTKLLPRTAQKAVDVFVHLLILGFHIYLIVLSMEWIRVTGGTPSPELKLPMKFIQISLPIGCGLAAVYAINNVIQDLITLKKE